MAIPMTQTEPASSLLPQEAYAAVFGAMPTGLFVLDSEGRILDVNRQAAAIFGYTPEEMRGRPVEFLLPRRYRIRHRHADFLSRLQARTPKREEGIFFGRHKDGFEIPLGVSLMHCQCQHRRMVIGVIANISKRRNLLAEHRRLIRRFKQLLQSSNTIVYTVDLNPFRGSYISDNVTRLLGYDPQQVLSEPNFWYRHLHPEDRRQVVATFRRQMEKGEGVLEYRFRHANGDWHWIYDSFRIVRCFHGQPTELLGSWTDITERKTAEIERDHMETELRLAQKLEAVGQLASGIAHEINTPIQFVSDSAYFLQTAFEDLQQLLGQYRTTLTKLPGHEKVAPALQQAEEEADLEYLEEEIPQTFARIFDGIERVTTIVRAMKEFGHSDQREKSPADLNKALQNTLTVARNEYKYVAEVETEFGSIPPVECLLGDINQVFLNLIVNAAHAIADVVGNSGDRGRITLRTYQDGEEVVIEIEDTGSGIPEAIAGRIFDPFFTTKEVGKGTGQGLAIARNIVVDKHGGKLSFESTPGEGTTFFIRLPIHAEENQS